MFETLLKIITDLHQFIDLTHLLTPKIGFGGAIEVFPDINAEQVITYTVIFLAVLAIIFGVGLAITAAKFAVKIDPRIEKIRDVLPGANCGACGFAGCQGYAEAVVTNPEIKPNLCTPGKETVAEAIAEITGKKAERLEPKIARVLCQGGDHCASRKVIYQGIKDCTAAFLASGGDKGCSYACLGYGTCVRACPFEAMEMSGDNIPLIDTGKCTACGICAQVCPKKVIEILSIDKEVLIRCSSKDKGSITKKNCSVGCIACGICVRTCPFEAITMENNLARINLDKCRVCGLCVPKCPTKTIMDYMPERGKAFITEGCNGCTICAKVCPVSAISGILKQPHVVDPAKCIGCGICAPRCPKKVIIGTFNAGEIEKKIEIAEPEPALAGKD